MNEFYLSDQDKNLMKLCGKSKKEYNDTTGTALKKVFLNWLEEKSVEEGNFEFENLKHSLIKLKIKGVEDKVYLCSVATYNKERKAQNSSFTVGRQAAEEYEKGIFKDSWVAIFAIIDNDSVYGDEAYTCQAPQVNQILTPNNRTNNGGIYFACSRKEAEAQVDLIEWIRSQSGGGQ